MVRSPGRRKQWHVHIHCDQRFPFDVFEVFVLLSFDLVSVLWGDSGGCMSQAM